MCLSGCIILASSGGLLLAEAGSVSVSGELLQSVLAVAIALVSGLVSKLLIKTTEKAGFQVDAAKQYAIEEATRKAIKFAAEWAAKRAKLQSFSTKGEQKLEVAAKRLLEKFPDISKDEAKKLVEEGLDDAREGAAHFFAHAAEAVATHKDSH